MNLIQPTHKDNKNTSKRAIDSTALFVFKCLNTNQLLFLAIASSTFCSVLLSNSFKARSKFACVK